MLINSRLLAILYRMMVMLALCVLPVTTFALNIIVVHNENSLYQTKFIDALTTEVAGNNNLNLTTINVTEFSIPTLKEKHIDIIVSLDNKASRKIMVSNVRTSTFHALTTLSRAREFAPCLPHCSKSLPSHLFFVLDQPAARQLTLIQQINPSFKHVGVIVTKHSASQLISLNRIASQKQLVINEHMSNADTVRYQIDDVSKSSDIILAIADTEIYNAASLSQVLLTSYRYKTPIIGFSKGFIKAGAVAGTVSSIKQLAKHLAEQLSNQHAKKPLTTDNVVYPKYFDVATNRNVARSLNLHFVNDAELKKKLLSNEAVK